MFIEGNGVVVLGIDDQRESLGITLQNTQRRIGDVGVVRALTLGIGRYYGDGAPVLGSR